MYRPPMFHYVPPKCPDCRGTGRTEYDGHLPRTCDRCNGSGHYINPVATIILMTIAVLTTVGPFLLMWWL